MGSGDGGGPMAPESKSTTTTATPTTGADAATATPPPPTTTLDKRTLVETRRGRRQRILWDSDSATPEGKTSITVLLDWLTAPGNYDRWRDSRSQYGQTRERLCTEINAQMKKHGIFHRENANIRTQISELERAFDTAVAWLVEQGFEGGEIPDEAALRESRGGGSDPGHTRSVIEAHVLRLCRYFHVLVTVMKQPPNQPRPRRQYLRNGSGQSAHATRRTSSATAAAAADAGGEDEESLDGDESPAADTSSENGHPEKPAMAKTALHKRKASAIDVAHQLAPPSAGGQAAVLIHPSPVTTTAPNSGAGTAAPASVVMNNFANFENTQRMILEAAREDREHKRFQLEEERNKLECEKLRFEVEAKRIELTVQKALARKKLLDAGISAEEVDQLLPATPSS